MRAASLLLRQAELSYSDASSLCATAEFWMHTSTGTKPGQSVRSASFAGSRPVARQLPVGFFHFFTTRDGLQAISTKIDQIIRKPDQRAKLSFRRPYPGS